MYFSLFTPQLWWRHVYYSCKHQFPWTVWNTIWPQETGLGTQTVCWLASQWPHCVTQCVPGLGRCQVSWINCIQKHLPISSCCTVEQTFKEFAISARPAEKMDIAPSKVEVPHCMSAWPNFWNLICRQFGALCSFVFLLQVGGRRICRVSLLRESSVKHVNSAHDIRGQGKRASVIPFVYRLPHVPSIPALTFVHSISHKFLWRLRMVLPTDYLPNEWIFFNSFSLKIFSAMLAFQMVSVEKANFVLFVRSLTGFAVCSCHIWLVFPRNKITFYEKFWCSKFFCSHCTHD